MRPLLFLTLLAGACVGCGSESYKVAPVSGKVTLDGKALPKAWVTFLPVASKGAENPGPTSAGQTDPEGNFTLSVDPKTPGAVVGKHKVWISTLDAGAPGAGGDAPDAGGAKAIPKDRVPPKYNLQTELTCEVPAGGKKDANFDLTSR